MYHEKLPNQKWMAHPQFPNGEVLYLRGEERANLKNKELSLKIVEQRLENDWSIDEALTLNKNYVKVDGRIYYYYENSKREEYILLEDMERAEVDHNINARTVGKRLNQGMSVNEALTKPLSAKALRDYERDLDMSLMNTLIKRDEQQQAMRVQEIKIEREKEVKPHLYNGTPQVHHRSDYCQYLMDNDIFPKKVAK